jgi:hypothetical protein
MGNFDGFLKKEIIMSVLAVCQPFAGLGETCQKPPGLGPSAMGYSKNKIQCTISTGGGYGPVDMV